MSNEQSCVAFIIVEFFSGDKHALVQIACKGMSASKLDCDWLVFKVGILCMLGLHDQQIENG